MGHQLLSISFVTYPIIMYALMVGIVDLWFNSTDSVASFATKYLSNFVYVIVSNVHKLGWHIS